MPINKIQIEFQNEGYMSVLQGVIAPDNVKNCKVLSLINVFL